MTARLTNLPEKGVYAHTYGQCVILIKKQKE